MAAPSNIISQEGYEKLVREKSQLKDIQIPETLDVLKNARSQGDLSENSDYHAAKEKLALLQRRLSEIEDIIKNVTIVEEKASKGSQSNGSIQYGSTVSFELEGEKEITVEIVGGGEVAVSDEHLSISLDSPLGKALEGKKKGDTCEMKLPSGNKKVTILAVS